ncbi:MAG: hypothetical protein ABWK01_06790 [Infirmifilum sp.]
MPVSVSEHYAKPLVQREVSDFLRGRWVAIHCERKMRDGRPLLVRYYRGTPLRVDTPGDLQALMRRLNYLAPRAFYGTASIYRELRTREDALNYTENIRLRTLTWDIDSTPEHWRATVEVARVILDELEKNGVAKSVWLKWSGRGMHVHIHENALGEKYLLEKGVLDATWSVVQLVLENIKEKVQRVNATHGSKIKVENLMDPQRVFTSPLSLHRQLDAVCVALKPEDLDAFDPSWTQPEQFRHNPRWREFEEGEAIPLAEEALRRIGGYLGKTRPLARPTPTVRREPVNPAPRLIEALSLAKLRIRENPGPLLRRKLLYDPRLAVQYLEDILSHYILGNITREQAESLISSTMNVTLLTQGYAQGDVEKLRSLYAQALELIRVTGSPEELRRALGRGLGSVRDEG